jgi:hypothetical protein
VPTSRTDSGAFRLDPLRDLTPISGPAAGSRESAAAYHARARGDTRRVTLDRIKQRLCERCSREALLEMLSACQSNRAP